MRNNARIGTTADLRARNIGDILTITIDEKHTVKNDDKVERKQDSSLKAKLDTFTLSDSTFSTGSLPHVEVSKSRTSPARQSKTWALKFAPASRS